MSAFSAIRCILVPLIVTSFTTFSAAFRILSSVSVTCNVSVFKFLPPAYKITLTFGFYFIFSYRQCQELAKTYFGLTRRPCIHSCISYFSTAIASISTRAAFGRFATSTQERAGTSFAKYFA